MLLLLLQINEERYAIATQQVIEVLPLVVLKTLPHTPEYIAGIFNYKGLIVPVIDLCQLIRGKRCSEDFSTRIVLVNYWGSGHTTTSKSETPHLIGLIAERVVETLQISETKIVDANIEIDAASYLGKIILDDQGMIQCIRTDYLLSEAEYVHLSPSKVAICER